MARPFELQSRDEEILAAIIDGTEYTDVPQSRIEYLLLELKSVIEAGGSSSDYAVDIDFGMNSQTFVVTAQLKNKDGDLIGTPKSVDIPLESTVVNGSYDNITKTLALTLVSGQSINIPIGDIISGLQTEITVQNPLNADLVDDSSSANKFTNATEKQTWNGKQDALTFDTTPTENSTNPVTSGGVHAALGSKADLANGFVPPAQLPPEVFLPEVTAEDAGKVLSVNGNGEWAAETPAGDNGTLIISASINTGTYVVTFEKSTQELIDAIKNALATNKNIIIIGNTGSTSYRLFQFVTINTQGSVTFESILRSTNSTRYWTISFTGSSSKTTRFTDAAVNDPA